MLRLSQLRPNLNCEHWVSNLGPIHFLPGVFCLRDVAYPVQGFCSSWNHVSWPWGVRGRCSCCRNMQVARLCSGSVIWLGGPHPLNKGSFSSPPNSGINHQSQQNTWLSTFIVLSSDLHVNCRGGLGKFMGGNWSKLFCGLHGCNWGQATQEISCMSHVAIWYIHVPIKYNGILKCLSLYGCV